MPSPFPGMDPYLENPASWPDVHHEIISEARAVLAAALRPRYVVRIEERVYLTDEDDAQGHRVPDVQISTRPGWAEQPFAPGGGVAVEVIEVAEPVVATTQFRRDPDEVHEARLEILEVAGRTVVTVIEVLSPANKTEGAVGRASFRQKRDEVMDSPAHWVEIDLLRAGTRVWSREPIPPCEYLVHVSRVGMRPQGQLWPIRLSQRLPGIPIPLKEGDPEARLDLQAVLNTAYDRAGYDLTTDYTREPVPPLPPGWAEWADGVLKAKGLRPGQAQIQAPAPAQPQG